MEEFEHTDTEARGKQGADVETSCPSGKPELKQMFPGLQFVLVFLRFSREFARDVMPSDGPGEVANFAALTVSLYTTSHHPPVSPDWVRGEQWTPWDSESVSCSRLPGSGSQGLQEIGEGAGSGIQISGLLDVLTPALGRGFSGPVGVNTGQPRPGNSANRGASHIWAAGIAFRLASPRKASVGSRQWGGEVGTGSPDLHTPSFN